MKNSLTRFIGVVILLLITNCTLCKVMIQYFVEGRYDIIEQVYNVEMESNFGGIKGQVFSQLNNENVKYGYIEVDGAKQILIDSIGRFEALLIKGIHDITVSSVGNSDLKIEEFYVSENSITKLDFYLGYGIVYCD